MLASNYFSLIYRKVRRSDRMTAYVQVGIVLSLLIGVGMLFISRSKRMNRKTLQWLGYFLIIVSIVLIIFGIFQYVDAEKHSLTH